MPKRTEEVIVISDGPPASKIKKIEDGLKSNAIHGWTYQLKILMLIYIRAVANGYENFNINTENEDDFGKFDDAIFEYLKEGKEFIRLVQIKHVKDEAKTISYDDLGHFDPKTTKHKKDNSKYRLIKYFESFINNRKDVKNCILLTNLSLGEDAELKKLFEEITTPDELLFDVSLPENKNVAKTCLPRDHKNNRKEDKTPKKYKLVYEQFKIIVEKGKKTQNMENSILNFCEKFIFATGQPNDNEMNLVLENEISRISELPMGGLVYAEYMNTFLDWLNNKHENRAPLTHADMKIIIPLIKLKAENLSKNLYYYEMLKDLKYELLDSTINSVTKYFEDENPNEKYLPIYTKFPILTLTKILQCLEYKDKADKGECLIIEIEENFIKKIEMIEYFKFCVIIFNAEVEESKVLKMLDGNQRKVVILKNPDNDVQIEDNCRFEHLQLQSKTKILDKKVCFDGVDVSINRFGSIQLFDQIKDADWLSRLIAGKLVLFKKILLSLEKNYIERNLDCNSDQSSFSEQFMVDSNQRLILLSAEAGMGKTTLLSSINRKNKIASPMRWTEIIKLTEHVIVFQKYKTNEDLIEFISTKILKYDSFTAQLFKHQIEEMSTTIIMFDGFDEISQKSKDFFLSIIDNLLKTNVKQIWITSRPVAVNLLEYHFSQSINKLNKFTMEEMITCFSDYWSEHGITFEMKNLIKLIKDLLMYCNIDFYVPLYTKMAAKYFRETDNIHGDTLDRIKLYNNFIQKNYSHLLGFKSGRNDDHHGHLVIPANDQLLFERYDDFHKILALHMLCPEYGIKHKLRKNEIDIVNSIGMATVNIDDNDIIHFDHRTFAEYFLAKYVFDELTDEREVNGNAILNLLLIFKGNMEFKGVLVFLEHFLDSSLILPNTIKLTDPESIQNFKVLLDKFLSDYCSLIDYSIFIFISFDNIDVMEYRLDKICYIGNIIYTCRYNIINLLNKYFKVLEKQLTNEQFKEFIVLCIMEYDLTFFSKVILDFILKLLKENFSNIYKIVFEYLIDLQNNHENAFIKFCEEILKSRSVDNFIFSIYSLAQSIKSNFSKDTINVMLENIIEASKNSKFNFDERGKFINSIKFIYPSHTFLFYRNVIKAFTNQKEALMNCLKVPETVLSFDEFENILTDNVEMFTEKSKNLVKIFGVFFLSDRYFQLIHLIRLNMEVLKPYFEKFIKYDNEELLAIWKLTGVETYFGNRYFADVIYDMGKGIFPYTTNQPEYVTNCFYNRPFMTEICYFQFIQMINAVKYDSKRLSLVNVKMFADISEIHDSLLLYCLPELLKTALKLDSLELLEKIVNALYKAIFIYKSSTHTKLYKKIVALIYIEKCFDTMLENSKGNCKDSFLNFVNNLKMKIKPPINIEIDK